VEYALEVKGLTMSFGGVKAIDDISFEIVNGEILGLIGSNGSGKTTFINVATNIYSQDKGVIEFNGQQIDHLSTYQIAQKGIGRTFQNMRLFKNLSVLDNVFVARHIYTKANLLSSFIFPFKKYYEEKKERGKALHYVDFMGLSDKLSVTARFLSYGEQRKLEIARVLSLEPSLIFLDEPTAGMNTIESLNMVETLEKISKLGITLLIVEHNMKVIMSIADRIVVLDSGKIICEGSPEDVQKDQLVLDSYMGEKKR